VRVACIAGLLLAWSGAVGARADGEGTVRFVGCGVEEREGVRGGLAGAARLAEAAARAVKTPENREAAREERWDAYRWWFGAYDPFRYDVVVRILEETRARFGQALSVSCGERADACPEPPEPDAPPRAGRDWGLEELPRRRPRRRDELFDKLAYSRHALGELGICAGFLEEPEAVRASVLFHEMTHLSGHTLDLTYTERGTRRLTERDSFAAVLNAESYEAFAESVAAGRVPAEARD
jgi:hypothetical protein